MASLAVVLKEEVVRLAGIEVRRHTRPVTKELASSQREIVALRRNVERLEGELSMLKGGASPKREAVNGKGKSKAKGKGNGKANGGSRGAVSSRSRSGARSSGSAFSAQRLKEDRQRLGLSADSYGALVGVSGLSIYNWESGRAIPRKSSVAAVLSVVGIGKREAQRRLDALNEGGASSSVEDGSSADTKIVDAGSSADAEIGGSRGAAEPFVGEEVALA